LPFSQIALIIIYVSPDCNLFLAAFFHGRRRTARRSERRLKKATVEKKKRGEEKGTVLFIDRSLKKPCNRDEWGQIEKTVVIHMETAMPLFQKRNTT
jgi:hypothetical protein